MTKAVKLASVLSRAGQRFVEQQLVNHIKAIVLRRRQSRLWLTAQRLQQLRSFHRTHHSSSPYRKVC